MQKEGPPADLEQVKVICQKFLDSLNPDELAIFYRLLDTPNTFSDTNRLLLIEGLYYDPNFSPTSDKIEDLRNSLGIYYDALLVLFRQFLQT